MRDIDYDHLIQLHLNNSRDSVLYMYILDTSVALLSLYQEAVKNLVHTKERRSLRGVHLNITMQSYRVQS